ncbi:myeloid differentiation primary response protein MyD88-like [Mytilus galloprovincialis]|nr:myeloid differentiation primary response protein MyD88 [Mytilus galloprovincialis]
MGVMVESYDAFVIHNEEGKDLEFVQEMARILEGPKYNLRLFLPWRDLQTTEDNETEVLAKIMVQRCRCAVVVISPNLLQSDVTSFLLSFVHSKYPSGRNSKLIPILIENCELPTILQSVTVCDFTKKDMRCWVWPRIASSMRLTQTRSASGRRQFMPCSTRKSVLPDILH